MADLHETIANAVPQIARGQVWCIACGRTQRVDGAHALRHGWPKCCGATMTIDSPEWRAAHARSTTQDRELLELAAKAAGLDLTGASYVVEDMTGLFYRATPDGPPIAWRPLTDDGDALRLAVTLRVDIVHFSASVRADVTGYDDCHEANGADPNAAIRRAIVRAAAEIGRTK